jgi:HEAT repeat protein
MSEEHSFETRVRSEDSGTFIEVPLDVETVFGKKRAPVRGTINGTPFESTIAVYGGRFYIPLKRALRDRAGVSSGDMVAIILTPDDRERRVELPEDFAAKLEDAGLRQSFERLSYSHQRQHVETIAEAKRAVTRERRIEKALDMLRGDVP